jgi:N-acetylmuramoyl-L-alanine amidase
VAILAVALSVAACGKVEAALVAYRVRPGDSLWSIGRSLGVPWQAIQLASGLGGTTIYPGQTLRVPVGQGYGGLSWAEIDLLARLVRAEAEAEPFAGQVAVAAVVLNRVRSPLFPHTVAGVIFEPRQFEPVWNGRIYLPAGPTAYRAVTAALSGWDPSRGALYFYNPEKASSRFLRGLRVTVRIGDHVFLR